MRRLLTYILRRGESPYVLPPADEQATQALTILGQIHMIDGQYSEHDFLFSIKTMRDSVIRCFCYDSKTAHIDVRYQRSRGFWHMLFCIYDNKFYYDMGLDCCNVCHYTGCIRFSELRSPFIRYRHLFDIILYGKCVCM